MEMSSTFSVPPLGIINDLGLQPVWSPEFDHEWHMENDPEWIDPEDWEHFLDKDGTFYSIFYSTSDDNQEAAIPDDYPTEVRSDTDENGDIIYF